MRSGFRDFSRHARSTPTVTVRVCLLQFVVENLWHAALPRGTAADSISEKRPHDKHAGLGSIWNGLDLDLSGGITHTTTHVHELQPQGLKCQTSLNFSRTSCRIPQGSCRYRSKARHPITGHLQNSFRISQCLVRLANFKGFAS